VAYIERERQRAEALQQEQLDWLYQHHTALEEQLDWLHHQHVELAQQTVLLRDIRRHSGLVYGMLIAYLIILALGVLFFLGSLITRSG
jgi:hypothetical protein